MRTLLSEVQNLKALIKKSEHCINKEIRTLSEVQNLKALIKKSEHCCQKYKT